MSLQLVQVPTLAEMVEAMESIIVGDWCSTVGGSGMCEECRDRVNMAMMTLGRAKAYLRASEHQERAVKATAEHELPPAANGPGPNW